MTFKGSFCYNLIADGKNWGISSAGRAPRLHRGGQRFDPAMLHHMKCKGLEKSPFLWYYVYRWRKLHKIKKGTFSFRMLNVYPFCLDRHLISDEIKCHFFITTIMMIRRNKMIEMSFKTLIIKVLVFTLSNLLSCWIRGRHSTTKCS